MSLNDAHESQTDQSRLGQTLLPLLVTLPNENSEYIFATAKGICVQEVYTRHTQGVGGTWSDMLCRNTTLSFILYLMKGVKLFDNTGQKNSTFKNHPSAGICTEENYTLLIRHSHSRCICKSSEWSGVCHSCQNTILLRLHSVQKKKWKRHLVPVLC